MQTKPSSNANAAFILSLSYMCRARTEQQRTVASLFSTDILPPHLPSLQNLVFKTIRIPAPQVALKKACHLAPCLFSLVVRQKLLTKDLVSHRPRNNLCNPSRREAFTYVSCSQQTCLSTGLQRGPLPGSFGHWRRRNASRADLHPSAWFIG